MVAASEREAPKLVTGQAVRTDHTGAAQSGQEETGKGGHHQRRLQPARAAWGSDTRWRGGLGLRTRVARILRLTPALTSQVT